LFSFFLYFERESDAREAKAGWGLFSGGGIIVWYILHFSYSALLLLYFLSILPLPLSNGLHFR